MPPRRDRERLLDVLEAIERIEHYTAPGWAGAGPDDPVWDAVSFNLLQIGEGLNHVSGELQSRTPDVDWRGAIGMRNVIAHDYFAVRREIVVDTVRRDIPALRKAVERLLRELGPAG